MRKSLAPPPLSRPFLVDEWHDDEAAVTIVADEHERAALAVELGIPAISSLKAELALSRRGGDRIEAHGGLEAELTCICVVSLDPFETRVAEPIDVVFAPEAEARAAEARAMRSRELQGSAPIEEPPDPILDGRIDLGALAAEFLALGLDPYPRKPGVDFAPPAEAAPPADSPFAALGRLKQGGPPEP